MVAELGPSFPLLYRNFQLTPGILLRITKYKIKQIACGHCTAGFYNEIQDFIYYVWEYFYSYSCMSISQILIQGEWRTFEDIWDLRNCSF